MCSIREPVARGPWGREGIYFQAVAWKTDESAVACVAGVQGSEPKFVALLVDPSTLNVIDFTEPFLRALKDPALYLQTAWTSDNRYLLVNDLYRGGCVIEPVPFRCVRIADRLPSRVNREVGHRYMSNVHPLAMSGWLRARDPDSVGYLVDYEGEKIVNLGKIPGTWSEDGAIAGLVGYDKRFHLQKIELPLAATKPADVSTGDPKL